MAPNSSELIEITNLRLIAPDTFVALDVSNPEDGSDEGSTVRLVGTVTGWRDPADAGLTLHVKDARDGHVMDIIESSIVAAFWAPMGYRP